jgi:hypothetical protein
MNADASTITLNKVSYKRGDGKQPSRRQLGPHSRAHRLAHFDNRTREGLIVNRLRKELIEHVGGNPSIVECTVIERCCWLQLRLAMLDRKMMQGHSFTEIDNNSYIAWTNALVRTMTRLGFAPKRNVTRPTLDEIVAEEMA